MPITVATTFLIAQAKFTKGLKSLPVLDKWAPLKGLTMFI